MGWMLGLVTLIGLTISPGDGPGVGRRLVFSR